MTPVPAGSVNQDGTIDYGIFGPGSMVWEVLLHPALVVFHHAGQQLTQARYAPIEAGIRDWEPLSKKGQAGELNVFHGFERATRGAGMHLPMWLGDTATAEHTAAWLHKIHSKVKGDVIDYSRPELGGYDAASPRESMWAALTEMHPMLRVYEAFAYRDGKKPHRLTPEQRDQFINEVGAYLRLHSAPENEIPTSMAELGALYEKYAPFWEHSKTLGIMENGEDYSELMAKSIQKNFKLSHIRAVRPMLVVYLMLAKPVAGALPSKLRVSMGMTPKESAKAVRQAKRFLPMARFLQWGPVQRHYMRIMWGADGVMLIESARRLHEQAKAERAAATAGR
jgi:uncharacterized protein (DUF2236 family)